MNVVYSSSDLYSEICGVSLTSLLENNKDVQELNIFIINNEISDLNKSRLSQTAINYNRALRFVDKPDLARITQTTIFVGRWNIGTFYRLYLSSILPKEIDRVIYLDCDTIVRHSLEDVFTINLGDCSVAGVDDCRSNLYKADIGIEPESIYINNGFLVIDLNKWRNQQTESDFSLFIRNRNGDCTYMDQAPLNGVLGSKKQIFELPAKYNSQRVFFDFSYKQLMKLRKPERHLSLQEYEEAISNPAVVHFTPVFISGTRPWQNKDKHPFAPEWRHYKELSLWKDEPYRKDDRKTKKKIMTVLCKICPRPLMIAIMSYLHSKWYPSRRIKIAKKNGVI